jgi:hypothetical protein
MVNRRKSNVNVDTTRFTAKAENFEENEDEDEDDSNSDSNSDSDNHDDKDDNEDKIIKKERRSSLTTQDSMIIIGIF